MNARDELIRSGLSHETATNLLIEHRDNLGYEELHAHDDRGWSVWTASFVHADGEMDMGLDTADLLALRDSETRAKAWNDAAARLDQIADETDARVAAHYGAASGIGPGSADMVREAANTVRSLIAESADAVLDKRIAKALAQSLPTQPE